MCTALSLRTKDGNYLFGRNMDLEYNFNQSVYLVPRKFAYKNVVTDKIENVKYAMIGMATIIDNHPMFADGMNEKGLACAGLNFPEYAYYENDAVEGKINLAPHDIIPWILGNFETTEEVKEAFNNVEIVGKTINPQTGLATLHWMVVDTNGKSIVIEKTKEKLEVYDNIISTLTNSPTFDWHVTNLRQYISASSKQPENTTWVKKELKPLGQGLGSWGLPGDFSTTSRFVRISFLRSRVDEVENGIKGVSDFFHMLNNVAMSNYSVVTPEGINDITQYTSCMCQNSGIYYYNTYNNSRINAVDMNKENLDGNEIKNFSYLDEMDINYQN